MWTPEGEKQRVLLVTCEAKGGIREHIRSLEKFADRNRFEISVCGPPDVWLASELGRLGASFVALPQRSWVGRAVAVRHLLRQGFSVVHSHGYRATLLATLATWPRNRTARVCTVHTLLGGETFHGGLGRLRWHLAAWALGGCRAVVAVSKAVARNVCEHFPGVGNRLEVIYNGVDVAEVRPARMRGLLAGSLGFDPNMPLVGTVARLSPEKGVHVLLEAARLLANHGLAVQYAIVGDGPERMSLEKQVHQLGLTGQVRFMGERREVSHLISLLDILVIPSLSEAFSLVALMGGILGVPVVATRSGGVEEVLGDELATFVPPGDARSLAKAILGVLDQGQSPSGSFTALSEGLATEAGGSFFPEGAGIGSIFTTYDTSSELGSALDLDNSPRGRARWELLERFDARRMVEQTTSLYETVLEQSRD